ncbi:hypothetical protein BsWGS_17545 [Bradybaena similaris]
MNKYNRVRQIGEGAFGRAVLVKEKTTAKQFVVKEINITKMSTKEREQARKEVAVLAQLKHPNIVAYVESFEERGSLYIVMNYCSGGDLYGRINERRGQLFSEDQILDWFVQLCLAVKHIHDRKILHRDIKCQNIFLTQSGTVQLGDFGIAKVLTSTAQLAHTCIGTPYYLSPEIVENMPYNNKSDIWSIGCVLYEITMLKHAFEAQNMKNLVLKIIRASYPPISPQFSYDLRGLIAQLFKRNPRDRPSVNSILRKNFIMQRVRKLLPAQDLADEFSHTVMHGHKIAKALPPAPKPSADPVKMAAPSTPRPGSAARKYDPAAVYGVPLNSSKNRMSGEKKRPSTPGRQLPIPGQAEWEKKKKERIEFEQKRRAEMKKREQEMNERRLKDHVEKQKVARINKAREEGWRNLVSPAPGDEGNRTPTPNNNQQYSPRPLPVPKANKNNRDRGNYDAYNEYLQKMYNKQTPPPDPRQLGNPNPVDVINMAAPRLQPAAGPQPWSPVAIPQPWVPPPNQQFNMGPLGVAVPAAIDQAGRDRYSYNMQLGAQAAQRARLVEDYIQRQRQAALNKMRAQHDLFGVYRPPSADRRTPVPAPGRGSSPKNRGGNGGGGLVARNNEEQEYLDKLRQIRIQNMRDRRDMPRAANAAEDVGRGKKSPNAEERRKKVEALKAQAEHWVEMKKNELQQQRLGIVPHGHSPTPVPMTDALHAIGAVEKARQSPSLRNEKPSPVPLTNALQIIAGAPSSKEENTAESERPKSALQKQRDNVLKKLNKKNPLRRKWGAPSSPAVQASEEVGRSKWGSPASPSIYIVEGQGSEVPRAQWRDGKDLHLSKITLEATASGMEATGLGDGVINMAAEYQLREVEALPAKAEENVRKSQWGRGTEVLKRLDQMTVSEDIGTADESSQSEPRVPPVGIGSTVILSSQKPPAQGRTITISCHDGGKAAADTKTQMTAVQDLPTGRPGTVVLSREYTAGKNLPVVDDTDSSQKIETGSWKETSVKADIWRTKNEDVRDGTTSVQMNLTKGLFDLRNIELLRTCSEPDLSQLSRTMVPEPGEPADDKATSVVHSTLRRHHSLDLTTANEDDSEGSDDEGDFSEEEIVIAYDNDDNDKEGEMDADIEEDDEEDDIKNIRETMMSILDDDNSDVSEKDKTLTNQQQSPDGSSSDIKTSTIKTSPPQKDDGNDAEVDEFAGNQLDADAVWNEGSPRDGDDEVPENNDLALTLDLENDDSDNETTFGDDSDDSDRFGRLEELRKNLELELGMEKLLEVYQTVQKLQEDEEGNIEDDAKLALQLLGSEKQHLFPKIFQLVMSDIAFTEG